MTSITPSIIADVLVLGAGPGGSATALHLERLGVRAAVGEARDVIATRPYVVDLSAEAVASARRAGIGDVFERRMGESTRGEAGATIALRELEQRARTELGARSLDVHYGAKVAGLEQARDGYQLVHLADGRIAAGKYVVNATGGRSGIEEQLGMGLDFHGDWTWFGAARTEAAQGLKSGTREGGLLGMVRNDRVDRYGELRPAYDRLELPPEQERWRSTMWYGWQNEIDGLSVFQAINSRDFGLLTPAELADRILAPARANGATQVLDAPRLIRAESASVEHARAGAFLAVGDAAGRAHPKQMRGTQLALLDAERAAHAIADALRNPERANEFLDAYDTATLAAHAEFGHDGTRVLASDPFRHLEQDVLELGTLDAWPMPAAETGAAGVAPR
jgi:2-polyprenyl-6-methoxyphenol hydroxylase-like FAD-dependent oxidoreductase